MKSPIKEESKKIVLECPVEKVREISVSKLCGRICVKINDTHLLAGATILSIKDLSVVKDLGI
jgi:hypothetical protein